MAEARGFYELILGCRVGRVGPDWLDVWFFGMQLTLQHRPDEVVPPGDQGVRHFGVVFETEDAFIDLVERLARDDVVWLSEPGTSTASELSGKRGAKVSDPSGNVIEIKYYEDRSRLFQE